MLEKVSCSCYFIKQENFYKIMAKTNIKPGLSELQSEEQRSARRKIWKALAVLLLFCVTVTLLILALFYMRKAFFSRNAHFKLKKLEIIDGSFWKGREKALSRRTGIAPGQNLFAVDYRELRRKIEAIPGIEQADIIRILPDKLQIKVTERIPRAILSNPAGRFVVDEKGVVMPRAESAVHGNLPVITSVPGRTSYRQGDTLDSLRPSLELIMMTLKNFQDITIDCIEPGDGKKLTFFMRYRTRKCFQVTLPADPHSLPYLLNVLQTTIINIHWKQMNISRINLEYNGTAVLNR
jgi:cell division septal protein FtsQ